MLTRVQGHNRALVDGRVVPRGFAVDTVELPSLIPGFRRMVREAAYDIAELPITTYLTAKAHGVPITALPIFPVRGFHHGAISVNRRAGISNAQDLAGRRIGVNRGYTVTSGVWARAILQRAGLDLSSVTWLLSGDEHVTAYRPPANVVPIAPERDIAEMLARGELAAAIGVVVEHPDVVPLFPAAEEAGIARLHDEGDYPINHVMVVRDDLLAASPGLAPALFEAFACAKRLYLAELRSGAIAAPDAADQLNLRVMEVLGDPLPFGVEANRTMLERLVGHTVAQGIIAAPMSLGTLFAADTLTLGDESG